MPEPVGSKALAVVPDSNVLIHGRTLQELPWAELGAADVEVLIVGPVLREVDALKNRPGRPGRIARDVSTSLRALLMGGSDHEVVREANPRVTRRLWLGDEARMPVRAGIDVEHGDMAIINRALWLMDQGRDVLLLTDDTLAAAHAKEFGLPFKLIDSSWLRAAEADEAQKEVTRLKAEIGRMKSAEPALRGWFVDAAGQPMDRVDLTLGRHLAIPPAQVDALMARVLAANPVATQAPPSATSSALARGPVDIASIDAALEKHLTPMLAQADAQYRQAYADWVSQVRRGLTELHIDWNRRRQWPEIVMMAVNEGSRPADTALVELVVQGDFTIKRPKALKGEAAQIDERRKLAELSLPMPPAPPRRDTVASLLLGRAHDFLSERPSPMISPLSLLSRTRNPDAFYSRTARGEAVRSIGSDCENWRHARDAESFRFVIGGEDGSDIRGLVAGRLSAANVTEPVEVRLPVRITFADKPMETVAEDMVAEFERISIAWRRAQRLLAASTD